MTANLHRAQRQRRKHGIMWTTIKQKWSYIVRCQWENVNNLCCHWLITRLSVTLAHEKRRELGYYEAKNGVNGTTRNKCNSNSSRNYLTYPSYQSTQHTTHLLPWLLAHLTDLPTHSLSADALFRTGVKWRHGAMTTSCRGTADLQSMRRDFGGPSYVITF